MENTKIEYIGKCLYFEREEILVVGDLHLGYEESLNNSGVFVSRVMFDEIIGDFDRVFEYIEMKYGKGRKKIADGVDNGEVINNKISVEVSNNSNSGESYNVIKRVILLGDVKHAFYGNSRQEWNDVLALFDYFLEKRKVEEIIITRGNHDNYLKTIAGKRSIRVEDYYIVSGIAFVHGDREQKEMDGKGIKYWIMGHGHPAVKIGDGTKMEKYKCFLTGKYGGREIIILPSFIEYNEGSDPRENDLGFPWKFDLNKFEVRVVGEDLKVLEFGKLGKMK